MAFASAFLYNTPLVAMMIPAVRDITRRTGLSGSKLFMGLSYIALLGGTITLIGTSVNLIVADWSRMQSPKDNYAASTESVFSILRGSGCPQRSPVWFT
jgi:Na+/H+ antiporter NhaD/arsenite permease-like protein